MPFFLLSPLSSLPSYNPVLLKIFCIADRQECFPLHLEPVHYFPCTYMVAKWIIFPFILFPFISFIYLLIVKNDKFYRVSIIDSNWRIIIIFFSPFLITSADPHFEKHCYNPHPCIRLCFLCSLTRVCLAQKLILIIHPKLTRWVRRRVESGQSSWQRHGKMQPL